MVAPTQTTRRTLLRIGTTAAAYAAGAAIFTGGAALASQAKGATPTGLSPGFAQALAAFAAAQRNASSHEALIVGPTRERWLAAKGCRAARDDCPWIKLEGITSLLVDRQLPSAFDSEGDSGGSPPDEQNARRNSRSQACRCRLSAGSGDC